MYKVWEIPLRELLDDTLRPLGLRCSSEVKIEVEHIVSEGGKFAGQDWWCFDSKYLNAPGGVVPEFTERVAEFADRLKGRAYIHLPCNGLTEARGWPCVQLCRNCGELFELPDFYPSLLAKFKTLLETE